MKVLSVLYLALFLSVAGLAQQVNFFATTDAKEVFPNSYFTVRFVLENADGSNFTPPDFRPLDVVSGPSTSSEISIVNGVKSSKKSFGYTLISKKPGVFTIKPATIQVGSKIYKTREIKIKVRKRDKSNIPKDNPDSKFFIKAELSDSIAYPGQELILKYKFYTTVDISDYRFLNESGYDGFIARELNVRQSQERVILNNKEYVVYTLKTMALFPQKTGMIEIYPANIRISIPDKRSRNIFFRSSKAFSATSNEVKVKVLPLPPKPGDDCSDNVGRFFIKSKITKRRVSTDDAFSLTIQIDGNGLRKFIEAPEISNSLKDFDVYDPKLISEKEYIMEDQLFSRKIFEYLLVPEKPGTYRLKIPYTYFNTDSAKYITLFTYPGKIQVYQGKNTGKLDKSKILAKYKLKPLKEDVRIIKKNSKAFFGSLLYWIIVGLALLIIPVMYFYRQYLIKLGNIDITIVKRNKAIKEAQKRLSLAKKYMEEGRKKEFYKEISDALLKFVADKLSIPNIDLNKDNVKSRLVELGVSESDSNEYISLLETCEVALYAGTPDSDMGRVYDRTKSLITDLELRI